MIEVGGTFENGKLILSAEMREEIRASDAVALQLLEEVIERFMRYGLMFYKKQLDYGTGNIGKFGIQGVAVRLYDKVERMRNLIMNQREPSNEALEDTLYDIIGYAVIALLLHDKVWPEDCP